MIHLSKNKFVVDGGNQLKDLNILQSLFASLDMQVQQNLPLDHPKALNIDDQLQIVKEFHTVLQ